MYYKEIEDRINFLIQTTLQDTIYTKGMEADGTIYKKVTCITDAINGIDYYYVTYPDNPKLICSVQKKMVQQNELPDTVQIIIDFKNKL